MSEGTKPPRNRPARKPPVAQQGENQDKMKGKPEEMSLTENTEVLVPAGEAPTIIDGVEIEFATIPARGGQPKPETYPFSKLPVSVKNAEGALEGPSFFIPEEENPEKHLAAARKWVRKVGGQAEFLFHARVEKKNAISGKRIWKTQNPAFKG